MEKYIDSRIKGIITETMVEEMFRKMGFFVMHIGQESVVNPLLQIEKFIKKCNGNFKLEKDYKEIKEVTYLKKLPDFVLVNKEGRVIFLEVKFRKDGKLSNDDRGVFRLYPETYLLVVNLKVFDSLVFFDYGVSNKKNGGEENLDKLKKSRFHIWIRRKPYTNDDLDTTILTLKEWLYHNFKIENDNLIKEYEDLVDKWLNQNP